MGISMSETERLVALEEIKRLKARRDRAVDTKDWELLEALHAPDHWSHNDGFDPWRTASEMMQNITSLLEGVTSVHHSHTPDITLESADRAVGIWAMEDRLYWKQEGVEHWLHGFGFYHESYGKRNGEWVFTSRQTKRLRVNTSPGADLGKKD